MTDIPVNFIKVEPDEIPEAAEQLWPKDAGAIRLYIGIPTHGGVVSVITATSLLSLATSLRSCGVDWIAKFHNGEMVARARNKIVSEFLESECTHLLFTDSDIGFQSKDVLAMLSANMNVIGAVYPLKSYAWDRVSAAAKNGAGLADLPNVGLDYCYNPTGTIVEVDGNKQIAIRSLRQCIEVGEIGTGFILIKREVFEMFAKEYPQLSYADDYANNRGKRITTFFDYGIVGDRYLSEDFFFCRKWRDMGGRVWAWPHARVQHAGNHVFEGAFDRLVQSAKAYKPDAPNKSTGD